MTTSRETERENTALAAEYAMGLLSVDEAKDFEQRMAQDPDLRANYANWCEHLSPMTDNIPNVTPPEMIKQQVMDGIFGAPVPAWRRLLLPLTGLAAAFVLAMFAMGVFDTGTVGTSQVVAEITAEDQSLRFEVRLDATDNTLLLFRFGDKPVKGRAYELWLVLPDSAPVSMGVLTAGNASIHEIPTEFTALLNGATLAISDESLGGSPTGAPTGAILAVGTLTTA